MNSLLNGLTNNSNQPANVMVLLYQAFGAALRGESPQKFMKNLAMQHPQLKKMNLDDLPGSAQQLCQQRGIDPNEVASNLDSAIAPFVNK